MPKMLGYNGFFYLGHCKPYPRLTTLRTGFDKIGTKQCIREKSMEQIIIDVDESTQAAFVAADEQKKRELSYLVSIFLGSAWEKKSLIEVMEEIADNAEKRGLTPEILEDLLADE